MTVNSFPPCDQVGVGHYEPWHVRGQAPQAKLVCMKNVGADVADYGVEVAETVLKVLLSFLHPLQSKCSWAIIQAMKVIHP